MLRRSFEKVSPDQRIQAIIIAFCFGALLEALAGFGTPVAITVVMLMALGFQPVKAAAVALIANTAPVAFGALATPIVTLADRVLRRRRRRRGSTVDTLGAMVGRQTPILAVVVPLVLVLVVDGRRGVRQTWLPAVVCGLAFGLAQFVASNYISVPLADIVAALVAAGGGGAAAAGLAARRTSSPPTPRRRPGRERHRRPARRVGRPARRPPRPPPAAAGAAGQRLGHRRRSRPTRRTPSSS